jgi:CheY-like chemotaxis protein
MSEKQYSVDMDLTPEEAEKGYSTFLKAVRNNLDPNSNTVLLIDDERGIRRKVARDVRTFDDNMVIVEASNGKEGLETLADIRKTHTKDPLFIVLDLNMPVMDGWTFLEHLKKEYQAEGKASGIPVLILSSTSGEKGILFTKKSVHNTEDGYTPLVTIAKEVCIDGSQYDASGEKGLMAWLKHFTKQ